MRRAYRVAAAGLGLLGLAGGVVVAQQPPTSGGANVNPIPGSVWTYLGATFGADWVMPQIFMPITMDATPGPPWPSLGYGTWNGARFSVNSYPKSGEIHFPTIPDFNQPSAVMGGINVPSNAVQTNSFGAGLKGMALSASTQMGAVGTYGFGGLTANSVSSWGLNAVGTNCPTPICSDNTGFAGPGSTVFGAEIDVNVMKTAAGVAPANLAVRGVEISGGSQTQVGTDGSSFALSINPLGLGVVPKIPWQAAIAINNNAAQTGIAIGAVGQPGTTTASQPVCFFSYIGTPTPQASCISADPGGIFLQNTPYSNNWQVGGVTYVSQNNEVLFLNPRGTTPTAPLTDSLAFVLKGVNNAGVVKDVSIQGVVAGADIGLVLNPHGGEVTLQNNGVTTVKTLVNPLANSTALTVQVNNNAGLNIAPVTLGAADSCGAGFRCMRVPN